MLNGWKPLLAAALLPGQSPSDAVDPLSEPLNPQATEWESDVATITWDAQAAKEQPSRKLLARYLRLVGLSSLLTEHGEAMGRKGRAVAMAPLVSDAVSSMQLLPEMLRQHVKHIPLATTTMG